jgi:hypothetical protein
MYQFTDKKVTVNLTFTEDTYLYDLFNEYSVWLEDYFKAALLESFESKEVTVDIYLDDMTDSGKISTSFKGSGLFAVSTKKVNKILQNKTREFEIVLEHLIDKQLELKRNGLSEAGTLLSLISFMIVSYGIVNFFEVYNKIMQL